MPPGYVPCPEKNAFFHGSFSMSLIDIHQGVLFPPATVSGKRMDVHHIYCSLLLDGAQTVVQYKSMHRSCSQVGTTKRYLFLRCFLASPRRLGCATQSKYAARLQVFVYAAHSKTSDVAGAGLRGIVVKHVGTLQYSRNILEARKKWIWAPTKQLEFSVHCILIVKDSCFHFRNPCVLTALFVCCVFHLKMITSIWLAYLYLC